MKSNKKRILIIVASLLLVAVLGVVFYVNDYYRSADGNQAYLQTTDTVTVSEIEEGLFFDGVGTQKALIFYPGAKVEYTAYAPIVRGLAELGMDCFLVKMPANLAILGEDIAEDILDDYHYTDWYLAGHSLGGAMAANYVAEHREDFAGLVLLASYPTKSLTDLKGVDQDELAMVREDFRVVSIYGSEDKVLNMENFEAGRAYMPQAYNEICIQGGNHAWFGNYGEQEGDGEASIPNEAQWNETASIIVSAFGVR